MSPLEKIKFSARTSTNPEEISGIYYDNFIIDEFNKSHIKDISILYGIALNNFTYSFILKNIYFRIINDLLLKEDKINLKFSLLLNINCPINIINDLLKDNNTTIVCYAKLAMEKYKEKHFCQICKIYE